MIISNRKIYRISESKPLLTDKYNGAILTFVVMAYVHVVYLLFLVIIVSYKYTIKKMH